MRAVDPAAAGPRLAAGRAAASAVPVEYVGSDAEAGLAIPGEPFELPTTSRRALENAGFGIIEQRQPSFLYDRSVLITGEVDRVTGFEKGFAIHQAWRGGSWEPDPLILDDQALIAHVAGRGLVVLTGCGPGDAASHSIADGDLQARFDVMPGSGQQPATVRASGDIDLANAARFQAALTKAAATSSEITTVITPH